MAERLIEKLDRLGAEAGIKQMTPEIYKFAQLLNDARLKDWENATYWYYDKDGKLYSSNEVKLRISSKDNNLHFGDVPQYVKDLHGLLPLSIKRPWVGLTDDERNDCLVSADPCETLAEPEARQLIEDVEAKLKEKNT